MNGYLKLTWEPDPFQEGRIWIHARTAPDVGWQSETYHRYASPGHTRTAARRLLLYALRQCAHRARTSVMVKTSHQELVNDLRGD